MKPVESIPVPTARVTLQSGRRLVVCAARNDRRYPAPAERELLIIDDRTAKDPSFQIRNSYRIRTRAEREEILTALITYSKENPRENETGEQWKRTVKAMEREWVLHNIAYGFGILRSSSMHVDLNNAEENGSFRYYFGVAGRYARNYARRIIKR